MATEIVRKAKRVPDLAPAEVELLLGRIGTAADTLMSFAAAAGQRAEGDSATDFNVIQLLAERIGVLSDGRFHGPHARWMFGAKADA